MINYAIFVVIALSFGVINMLLIKENAEVYIVRPTKGLAYSITIAFMFAIAAWLGIVIGDLLMYPAEGSVPSTNRATAAGLLAVVAVLEFFPFASKKRQRPMFDISQFSGIVARGVGQSMYVLLAYVALGMIGAYETRYWVGIVVLLLIAFVLCWLGFMFGRQKVALRERRWAFMAFVFFLAVVLAIVLYG